MIPDLRSSYVAEDPAPVNGIVCTYVQVYEEMEMSPVEIRIPIHWILIVCSMTTLPPVVSPSNILPLSSSHCAFGERLKNNTISVLRDVRKIAAVSSVVSLRPSVCLPARPSVRMEQLGSQWTDFSVKLVI